MCARDAGSRHEGQIPAVVGFILHNIKADQINCRSIFHNDEENSLGVQMLADALAAKHMPTCQRMWIYEKV